MAAKWSYVLSLVTFLVVGGLVFFFDGTMAYSSIWRALTLAVPASFIAFVCGYYLGKILSTSRIDAELLAGSTQKRFVEDLLLTPDELRGNESPKHDDIPLDLDSTSDTDNEDVKD